MRKLPSVEYLKECFLLNEITGELTYKVRPDSHFKNSSSARVSNAKTAGKKVYVVAANGYLSALIHGYRFLAHRIVWKMINGEDAPLSIDHIDQNRKNNAPSNLRLATKSENARNVSSARSSSSSGILGVHFSSRLHKWRADICINGKNVYLGLFESSACAEAAYLSAKSRMHGDFSPLNGASVHD